MTHNIIKKTFSKIFYSILCSCVFYSTFGYCQTKEPFETVHTRVSKSFFKTPELAKKDAYKLEKLATTNLQKQTSYKFLGYVYDLTGELDSARYYLKKRLDFNKSNFNHEMPYYEAVISYTNWG